MICRLRALGVKITERRNGTVVDHGKQQIAAQTMAGGLEAENNFQPGHVDGAEDSQARGRTVHSDPFFAAVTHFAEKIFDEGSAIRKPRPETRN
jgi:hypothetical protein